MHVNRHKNNQFTISRLFSTFPNRSKFLCWYSYKMMFEWHSPGIRNLIWQVVIKNKIHAYYSDLFNTDAVLLQKHMCLGYLNTCTINNKHAVEKSRWCASHCIVSWPFLIEWVDFHLRDSVDLTYNSSIYF